MVKLMTATLRHQAMIFGRTPFAFPFYKPTKQVTAVRVNSNILLWLKGQGKAWMFNAIASTCVVLVGLMPG